MPPPKPASLADALRSAGQLDERWISDATTTVRLDDLLTGSCIGPRRDAVVGKTVLIALRSQMLTAVALNELDGLAARVVLCPPDLKPEHLASIIETAEVEALLIDVGAEPPPGAAGRAVIACGWPLQSREPAPSADHPTAWLLLTSGTTGVPKLVQHSFAGLTAAIRPRAATARPTVWATFYDIRRYGGLQIFLRGMLGSGSLVLSDPGEPIADTLHRYGRAGVSHLSGTPSHWRRALMSPSIAAIDPVYVRLSGEIADQPVLDALRQQFPQADIGHAYASTEAGVGFEVDDGRAGFPAALLDRTGGDVAMNVVDGSLRIRSTRAASRYIGPADQALVDADGFVDTGDMVEARDGRWFFVGRRGGIINVGGLKVHPEEVEQIINRHPAVRMSLCQGRKNPITGAIVVATVVLKDAGDTAGAPPAESVRGEILADCRKALPAHMVPALLRFAGSLDVTAAGKLVRPHA